MYFGPLNMKVKLKFFFLESFSRYQLSKSESVEFLLIEPVIHIFTDSSLQKYFSLSNQFILTD